jgi:hypothetical protein
MKQNLKNNGNFGEKIQGRKTIFQKNSGTIPGKNEQITSVVKIKSKNV